MFVIVDFAYTQQETWHCHKRGTERNRSREGDCLPLNVFSPPSPYLMYVSSWSFY